MSASSRAVKLTAKTALKGNWLRAIIITAAMIFAYFVCSLTVSLLSQIIGYTAATVLLYIFLILVLAPLALGLLRFFWRMLFGAADNPIILFYYFSNKSLYIKALKLIFSVILRLLCVGLILYLPAIIVWLLSQSFFYDLFDLAIPIWSAHLDNTIVFLRVTASVILLFISVKYHIAPVLLVADDNIDVLEAVYMSKTIAHKSSLDYIFLVFSFLGWLALSVFVIPLVFTLPYMITAYAIHVRFAIAEYNMHIEMTSNDDFQTFAVGC